MNSPRNIMLNISSGANINNMSGPVKVIKAQPGGVVHSDR